MQPRLFGIENSNVDFSNSDNWGKNKFNNTFPISLLCYMSSINLPCVYLFSDKKNNIIHKQILAEEVIGTSYGNANFSFESAFSPYQQYVINDVPRIDVVTIDLKSNTYLRGIEIKLTALPDNSTYDKSEDGYGSELVVRPDTIVYLALSVISAFNKNNLNYRNIFSNLNNIKDWSSPQCIIDNIDIIYTVYSIVIDSFVDFQTPFLLQPVWKTKGKAQILDEDAFDVFVWSNIAFAKFILHIACIDNKIEITKITRQMRTVVWIVKMLYDYYIYNKIDHQKIIDELSFNTKNDKAFAANGSVTNKYMKCTELSKPRLRKSILKEIILGGGQNLLSPERRLDAVILNTPGVFD